MEESSVTDTKTIIAIVGESGSGKTSLSFFLQERFGIPAIVSYTTRPQRRGEINGRDHWFVETGPGQKDTLAWTIYGDYEYWAVLPEEGDIFSYVIDEAGLLDLKEKNQCRVISLYIKRGERSDIPEERKSRDIKRKVVLPMESYDYIIENEGSIEEFYSGAEEIIRGIPEVVSMEIH